MFLYRRILKPSLLLAGLLLMLIPFWAVRAQEGKDITAQCLITARRGENVWENATDRSYKTFWGRSDARRTSIGIVLPEGTETGGLYLCFSVQPQGLELYEGEDESPFYSESGETFAHRYIPFEGKNNLRLELWGEKQSGFAISEFFVIEGAEPPDWVQRWEEPLERANLLVLVAHPDDELLWMGGAIPYYATERGMDVAVAYLTCANNMRRSEMLNGLWTAGVRHYPYIGSFRDKRRSEIKDSYLIWGGKEKVEGHIVSLYRRLKPQVVLSHDLKGEYGHPAHIICARAAVEALDIARDEKKHPESLEAYGAWDVPKLYLHLYGENTIEMDWQQTLASLGGATPLDVTSEAFAQHRSQQSRYAVEITGPYSAARFGLVRSLVGNDVQKNDFFENIK